MFNNSVNQLDAIALETEVIVTFTLKARQYKREWLNGLYASNIQVFQAKKKAEDNFWKKFREDNAREDAREKKQWERQWEEAFNFSSNWKRQQTQPTGFFADCFTQKEIKSRYRELCLTLHPDKPTGNEEKFKEMTNEYQKIKL